jgi:hypothetical protein
MQLAKHGAHILQDGAKSKTVRAIQQEFGIYFGKMPSLASVFNLMSVHT